MNSKKVVIFSVIIALFIVAFSSFAVSAQRGNLGLVDLLAELTGKPVSEIMDDHFDNQKTFGEIAEDAGVLDAMKAEMLTMRTDQLAAAVADGSISQELADEIVARIAENQANCDGVCNPQGGMYGNMYRQSDGFGPGQGMGRGMIHNRYQIQNNFQDGFGMGNRGGWNPRNNFGGRGGGKGW